MCVASVGAGVSGCAITGAEQTPGQAQAASVRGGELSVSIASTGARISWDPRSADPEVQRIAGPAVMATLLRPDPDGGPPAPWLAESATTDSTGRVWTITLRSGLTFADGSPFTAKDAAFTLTESAADPVLSTRFGVADGEGYFVSATPVDERTVVVQLRRPNLALDRLVLAAPEFGCVREGYGGIEREDYFARPSSCGPFLIDAAGLSAGQVRLVRNTAYYDAESVLPDSVVLSTAEVSAAAADVIVAPPSTTEASTAAPSTSAPTPGASDVTSLPGVSALLVLQSSRPTSDTNLRQALRAALDPAALLAAADGSVPPTAGLTPVGWPGALTVPVPGGRPDIAREAVALVPERRRALDLLIRRDDAVAVRRAESIASSAASAGLEVTITARSDRDYQRAIATGSFEAALVDVAPPVAHTAEISRRWAWTAGFGGGWPSAIGERAYPGQLGGPEAAAEATAEFEDVVRRRVFVVPLASDVHRVRVRTGITGVVVGPEGALPLERFGVASAPTEAP
jgi:peptide/nickel transport system substrate-binding protein